MALKLKKEYAGVVYSPRREEIYSNGGGVLYPRRGAAPRRGTERAGAGGI